MRRRTVTTALMLAPVVTVLGALYVGAFVTALLQSFGWAPWYGVREFTLQHYRSLFATPGFWRSLGYTFYYALTPTLIGTVLSVYLAHLLHRRFRGRAWVGFLYKLPLMVPYLVGVALTVLLWSNGGLVARVGHALGLIETTRDFPRLLNSHAGVGIMLVYLWKQVPFATLVIYSTLVGLDADLEAAARTLGASARKAFWFVTLPRLTPGIVAASLIVFAFNFGSFEVPFILGGGFPNTLPVEAWRAFSDADPLRRLSAMAIVMVITLLSSLLLILYLVLYRRLERGRGRV
ncbi:ABC transporter permease subunit [soil metagenome]